MYVPLFLPGVECINLLYLMIWILLCVYNDNLWLALFLPKYHIAKCYLLEVKLQSTKQVTIAVY